MDTKRIATREGYGDTLCELMAEHENILVFDADLSDSTRTGRARNAFPDRHINCGIAEQNMMAVAAGASAMGYVCFASSFAMFAVGRAFDQIRNSISYPFLNVKIGASHAGISVGEDGASHQCCEDIALMRTIPGMVIMNPSDDVEARAVVRAAYERTGPVYMRFGRLAVPVFHDPSTFRFRIGVGEVLRDGADVAIIATGLMVAEAVEAADILASMGIHARVINMCTIKPLDEEIVIKAARECGGIITCEEHSVIGGLGEAVSSLLSEKYPTRVKRIGMNDRFGCSGSAPELLRKFGLCADNIVRVTREFIAGGA